MASLCGGLMLTQNPDQFTVNPWSLLLKITKFTNIIKVVPKGGPNIKVLLIGRRVWSGKTFSVFELD